MLYESGYLKSCCILSFDVSQVVSIWWYLMWSLIISQGGLQSLPRPSHCQPREGGPLKGSQKLTVE